MTTIAYYQLPLGMSGPTRMVTSSGGDTTIADAQWTMSTVAGNRFETNVDAT
jgi:hypothetical protein